MPQISPAVMSSFGLRQGLADAFAVPAFSGGEKF